MSHHSGSRTHPRSLGNLRLLLPTLLVLPLSAGWSAPPPRSAEVRPLALLPSSPEFLVSVDYSTLRKSDLIADFESRLDSLPEQAEGYRRFVRETGVDPRQDLDLFVMSVQKTGGGSDPGFLLIAQGRFGPSRLVDALKEKGGTASLTQAGIPVWSSRPGPGEDRGTAGDPQAAALAQPNETTLLFGSEGEVLRALDVITGTRPPDTKTPRFRELLAGAERRAPVWAVLNSTSLAGRISREIGQNSPEWNPGGALSSVDSVRMAAWVGRDVDLKVEIDAKDTEAAGLLADLIRGALAAGKLGAKDRDPELLKILQEAAVAENGTAVQLRLRIPTSRLQEK